VYYLTGAKKRIANKTYLQHLSMKNNRNIHTSTATTCAFKVCMYTCQYQ